MVFSSAVFIFAFLPVTLILYYVSFHFMHERCANFTLLVMSSIFYLWGGLNNFLVLVTIILINYFLVLLICRLDGLGRRALFLLVLLIDIGNLVFFKYINFLSDNLLLFFNKIGVDLQISFPFGNIVLPIGISFYTFQILSYVIDVYYGRVDVQKNLVRFALYVMMFPQLIAGPIVRYKDINSEIENRRISLEEVEYGVKRFIVGFAKKVFLANTVGKIADAVFSQGGSNSFLYAWLGAICYTLQIFYDFSAYSDMAIGLGGMMGFHFLENFDHPYCALSIQEFWRRWHISLSSWFRDYVYIPLGGNRKGKVKTYLNLSVVFLLTGIWHGAAWQFIFWGIYHGFFSIVERLGFNRVLKKVPTFFSHIYTMVVVIIGWVFFRANNIKEALHYIERMFSFHSNDLQNYAIVKEFSPLFWLCLCVGLILAVKKNVKGQQLFKNISIPLERGAYILLWLISVMYLSGVSYNPFIYFQF